MRSEESKKKIAKYKQDWDKGNRKNVPLKLKKELVEEFDAVLKQTGETRTQVLRNFIISYIEKNKKN